jgi:hypothetical protein
MLTSPAGADNSKMECKGDEQGIVLATKANAQSVCLPIYLSQLPQLSATLIKMNPVFIPSTATVYLGSTLI